MYDTDFPIENVLRIPGAASERSRAASFLSLFDLLKYSAHLDVERDIREPLRYEPEVIRTRAIFPRDG